MAIAVASVSTTALDPGSNTIAKPSGLAEGDLMIAVVVGIDASANLLTVPAGWTQITYSGDSDDKSEMLICYKAATAGDVAASNFTFTNADGGIIYRITGAASPSLITGGSTGSQIGAVIGSQTLVLIAACAGDNASRTATFSGYSVTGGASPTFTERMDEDNNKTFALSFGIADGIYNSSANITAISVTQTGGTDGSLTRAVKIPQQQSAVADVGLATVDVTASGLVAAEVTAAPDIGLAEINVTTHGIVGAATSPTQWSNQTKNSSNWTNQNKSL